MNIDSLTLTSLSLSTSTTSSTKSSSTTASATSTRASSQPLSTPEYVVALGIAAYPPLANSFRSSDRQAVNPSFSEVYVVTYSLVVVSSFSMYCYSWIRKNMNSFSDCFRMNKFRFQTQINSMERSTTNQSLFIDIASMCNLFRYCCTTRKRPRRF